MPPPPVPHPVIPAGVLPQINRKLNQLSRYRNRQHNLSSSASKILQQQPLKAVATLNNNNNSSSSNNNKRQQQLISRFCSSSSSSNNISKTIYCNCQYNRQQLLPLLISKFNSSIKINNNVNIIISNNNIWRTKHLTVPVNTSGHQQQQQQQQTAIISTTNTNSAAATTCATLVNTIRSGSFGPCHYKQLQHMPNVEQHPVVY
ncbi:hypothetical protein EVAR_71398_1 [Eumeta japonica]|uniref:Uncharacterized protein n=1 Tax=Eumeta variegata TaxID=151549 RepID=A0A4C2A4Y8_EUMVA|nr:hypothetical protein EVAR_71398_1 [Eumeta japonica]